MANIPQSRQDPLRVQIDRRRVASIQLDDGIELVGARPGRDRFDITIRGGVPHVAAVRRRDIERRILPVDFRQVLGVGFQDGRDSFVRNEGLPHGVPQRLAAKAEPAIPGRRLDLKIRNPLLSIGRAGVLAAEQVAIEPARAGIAAGKKRRRHQAVDGERDVATGGDDGPVAARQQPAHAELFEVEIDPVGQAPPIVGDDLELRRIAPDDKGFEPLALEPHEVGRRDQRGIGAQHVDRAGEIAGHGIRDRKLCSRHLPQPAGEFAGRFPDHRRRVGFDDDLLAAGAATNRTQGDQGERCDPRQSFHDLFNRN